MKLSRFFVSQHLLLRELELRFDRPNRLDRGQYALDFLVGVNGSGKSTVLRALTQVFANLRAGRYINFDFELEYALGTLKVLVTQKRQSDSGETVLSMTARDDNGVVYNANTIDHRFLPRQVVVHSTGNEAEWQRMLAGLVDEAGLIDAPEELLQDAIQRSIVELPGSMVPVASKTFSEGEPPFWLMQAARLPAITVCGLLAHMVKPSHPLSDVLTSIGIHSVTGFSLRFRLHKKLSPFETYEQLKKLATAHVQQGTDHLLVFDLIQDAELPAKILGEFANSLELYRKLDQLQEDSLSGEPTLQQVNIFVERPAPLISDENEEAIEIPGLLLVDWLSDGEQSFLGRMAMLTMLETDESLILLDEPEVHFNDYWKREVVDLLDIVMQSHSNHLLITTHSSILLSDVTDAQVTVLVKDENGWARRQFLRLPLLAVDPSEIMVNYFGTERSVGARSTRLLGEAVQRGEIAELESLLKVVGPGYWRYRIQDRLEELRAASH